MGKKQRGALRTTCLNAGLCLSSDSSTPLRLSRVTPSVSASARRVPTSSSGAVDACTANESSWRRSCVMHRSRRSGLARWIRLKTSIETEALGACSRSSMLRKTSCPPLSWMCSTKRGSFAPLITSLPAAFASSAAAFAALADAFAALCDAGF